MEQDKEYKEFRSRRARTARSKGNKAQREIAKILGLWFFKDLEVFHSTPCSGGLRWKSNVGGTRGDIVAPPDIDWPISIEIKNSEKSRWDFYQLLLREGPIWEWWDQCKTDAVCVDKEPMLIIKRNQIPYFIIVHEDFEKNQNVFKVFPCDHFHFYSQGLKLTSLRSLLVCNQKYNNDEMSAVSSEIFRKVLR